MLNPNQSIYNIWDRFLTKDQHAHFRLQFMCTALKETFCGSILTLIECDWSEFLNKADPNIAWEAFLGIHRPICDVHVPNRRIGKLEVICLLG